MSAHVYTPGLKVKAVTVLRKVRKLPLPGKVLVRVGDKVSHDTVVAETEMPGLAHLVKVATELGLSDDETDLFLSSLTKKEGDEVEENEIIALFSMFFGLIKRFCRSPVKGTIESISDLTMSLVLREPVVSVRIKAYIPGVVTEVLSGEGTVIEASVAFVQGVFGIGGETEGELMISGSSTITAESIGLECAGKVLVGRTKVTCEALQEAARVGVRGVVVGGIEDRELARFLGYEIGVAITGAEETGLTVILTEGFGNMEMSTRTFELFKSLEGRQACINGATQIRAGVLRPEIIIPLKEVADEFSEESDLISRGMTIGTPIRVIREPYFGAIGRVSGLPVELTRIETESMVRVVEVKMEGGRQVVVPRANVEIIEE